jgi:hypothetical protein
MKVKSFALFLALVVVLGLSSAVYEQEDNFHGSHARRIRHLYSAILGRFADLG